MTIESLASKVEDYKESLEQIEIRRSQWTSTTRQLIYDALQKVKNRWNLDWYVTMLDTTKNMEGVNLFFGSRPSGILEKTGSAMKSYFKHGGTLAFAQAYTGHIFVIFLYPSIDELATPLEPNKILARTEPSSIDEEFILKQVATFLEEMRLWESNNQLTPIGFNFKK